MSVVGPIDEAKGKVSTVALMEHLTGGPGERRGKHILFRCLLHDDHHPSNSVDPEKDVWFCHPCGVGGDVVRLAQLVWGHEDTGRGAATAAAELLMAFGHEVPQRPDAWFRRQERQKPVRDRIREGRVEHVAALVFRLIWMPWLKRLPEDVREDAKESAWRDSLWMADRLYTSRRPA